MACRHLLRRLPARPVQLAGVPAWAPVGYEGPARELVRALKFRGAVALVDAMAAQIAADCLERLGAEGTHVGRGRHERRAGPAGRVLMRSGQATEAPAHALLVDDVVTTGGTLAACAAALRSAGTGEVGALAFARTLGR